MDLNHNLKMQSNNITPKEILPLFPIAVGCYSYPDKQYLEDLTNKVREDTKDRDHNVNWNNKDLKHYYQRGEQVNAKGETQGVTLNNNFFKNVDAPELEQWMKECAYHFHTKVLGYMIQSEYLINDSWVNCNRGNGGQSYHAHVNSFLSGTMYLDHDDDAAPIEFQSPKFNFAIEPHIGFTPDIENATVFSQPRAVIKPDVGDFLIWESHLRHGYSDNNSPNRISLSVNMIPRIVFSHRYGFEVKMLESELPGRESLPPDWLGFEPMASTMDRELKDQTNKQPDKSSTPEYKGSKPSPAPWRKQFDGSMGGIGHKKQTKSFWD